MSNHKKRIYKEKSLFFGDIHNHCGISYGHGSLEDALNNARLQLDFVSITGHAFWPDMPEPRGRMKPIADYHLNGFRKLESEWSVYMKTIDEHNIPGIFVTLPSYEMHSNDNGDYVVYFRDSIDPMIKTGSFQELQDVIREKNEVGIPCFIVPHHIGYARGYRGINWETFCSDVSPLVEIISMHGCAESDEAPYNYLHTMGPRNGSATMQGGLEYGHHFGVIGSTDHHSAHPGSYGYGVAAVWADTLSRESIWEALTSRRTYAISGDRIELAFAVNDSWMGSLLPYVSGRNIDIEVTGTSSLDHIEILKNNRVLKRFDFPERKQVDPFSELKGKLTLEFGWGEKGYRQDWDVKIRIEKGKLFNVEPHFHGIDVVAPEDDHYDEYRFTEILEDGGNIYHFRSLTWGNVTTSTNSNQAVTLELEGSSSTMLELDINGKHYSFPLTLFLEGSRSCYLGGFLSGAFVVRRFSPVDEYSKSVRISDEGSGERDDVYYVRTAQRNNQWAWSSPVRLGEKEQNGK